MLEQKHLKNFIHKSIPIFREKNQHSIEQNTCKLYILLSQFKFMTILFDSYVPMGDLKAKTITNMNIQYMTSVLLQLLHDEF